MGIFDLFRDWFPVPQHNERLGPNDLPTDILTDLRQNNDNEPDERHYHDNQEPRFHSNYHFHGNNQDAEREFENVFKEMDNMFKSFFRGPFDGGLGGEFGNGPMLPLENEEPKSLREKMLDSGGGDGDDDQHFQHHFQHHHDADDHEDGTHKFSFGFRTPFFRDFFELPFGRGSPSGCIEESPFDSSPEINAPHEDQDLDNSPKKPNIDDLLAPRESRESPDRSLFRFPDNSHTTSSSTFKYSTITRKMNPDGSVETSSKKRDSEGNEEVTVSRNLGEQTHTVITKKNKDGEEEKVENFVNMDENDLQEFEGKWKSSGHPDATPRDGMAGPGNPRDLFSSWWKPRL